MTSVREGPVDGAPSARVRDLHRKLLERVLLRSDTQSVKDVFRRYDRERAGVLTLQQFRALLRDHDFLDTDADLLLRHLGTKDQSVSFHAFMGDTQLGTEQNYPPKNINASNSPKKVQQLSQLPEQKKNANRKPKGTVSKAGKQAVELVQDPMEAIRTKLRQRVMGHSKSIREVFMEYDTDGSGFLDYEEFGRFMAKYEFAPEETQTIVDYLDRDRSGTVDYDEFAAGLLFCRPPIQVPVASAHAQAASKADDKVSAQRTKPQVASTQPARTTKTSKETGYQQVLDSIRSRFGETLKKSKQLRDIRAEFGRYDVDGNNCLDHQEFGALLVGLGVKLKAAELRAVLQEIDPDEDERIDFQTITKLLNAQETLPANTKRINKEQQQHKASVKPDDEALVTFRKFDRDGSGKLEYEAFRRLMHGHGVTDDSEIDAMIDQVDVDGSGSISYTEFVRVFPHRIQHSSRDTLKMGNDINAKFEQVDRDGSGQLGYADFRRLMQHYGVKDNAEIDALIDEIDADGSGFISLQAFTHAFDRRVQPSPKKDSEVLANLRISDRDERGERKHDGIPRIMHKSGVSDKDPSGTLADEIDTHDQNLKPTVRSTRQHLDCVSEAKSSEIRLEKKASQAEDEHNTRSRLVALQEQELQFMERVLRRHNSIENGFRHFDREGRNEMDSEQFRDFMGQYGITEEASISMLLKRLDADNSGTIDLHEFLSVFNAQRLARHKGGTTRPAVRDDKYLNTAAKSVAHGDKRQNGVANSDGHRVVRRGVKAEVASVSTGAQDTKSGNSSGNGNRAGNAARLRELEEKWIRGALTGHDSLRLAFASVDRDQDGEISGDEFRSLMNLHGICDEQDVASLMKKLDVDGNGCIGYEEFESIFHETRVSKSPQISVAKPAVAVAPVESKNARGARMRDLQIKWMKRVLSCHDSIETAFYQYDEDGNGELDHDEFRHFMKRYGIVKNDDIETLIKRLDTDGSGTISFEAFSVIFNPLRLNPSSTTKGISAMAAAANEEIFDPEELESILEIERELAQRMAHQTRDLRLAFRKFDTNGNGLLEYKEFRSVLKSYRLPEMEIRKVIRHLDRDVSGFIDYKEFIAGFGALKESAAAAPVTQKKVEKRVSPGKGKAKTKVHVRRSPSKPQRLKPVSPETLKKTMLERILAIHGTVQGAFREYDLDKEGSLNEAQFGKLVLDCEFSRDEAALLLDIFDQDQSGTVEYQEFLAQLVVKGVQ
ncbi:EF-hand domain pair [Phytophthora infestans]|uniref:EF-hand domain pair n=1 Tax=Phytophthora infestans TaxID=4787 RepID=A0A833SSF1_PHYIN|nr:EF-hand domain pair [Phytophthora infestans]KAF4144996.1 EF-hand domain pair [Phytophthora infestans]KAI9993424.1 hypothetical protein PInf_015506 [Phytophthora infestans]